MYSIIPECIAGYSVTCLGHCLWSRSKTPDFFAARQSKIMNWRFFTTAWIWRLLVWLHHC